jgi:protocatechuate 3,4-dioxygenase beta subunit
MNNRDQRLAKVVDALVKDLHEFIEDHRITEEDLRHAMDFLTEVGKNNEMPGLADAFAMTTVADNVTHEEANRGATPSNIEGPFYLADAPRLNLPYRVGRPDEAGDPLVFRGRIVDGPSGRPVPSVLVDLWQADAVGNYDIQDPGAPAFNLRGRLTARDGIFELRTVVPGAYEIPKNGAVGRLLKLLGRHAFRPRHIHFKISADGWRPLTTQIYFAGDQWIESDSIGAAKPGLVAPLKDRDGVLVSEYTFRLTPRK